MQSGDLGDRSVHPLAENLVQLGCRDFFTNFTCSTRSLMYSSLSFGFGFWVARTKPAFFFQSVIQRNVGTTAKRLDLIIAFKIMGPEATQGWSLWFRHFSISLMIKSVCSLPKTTGRPELDFRRSCTVPVFFIFENFLSTELLHWLNSSPSYSTSVERPFSLASRVLLNKRTEEFGDKTIASDLGALLGERLSKRCALRS